MHSFTYRISLRIRHSSIDPETISNKLSLSPKYAWKAGEPRRSPKGTELAGRNKDTYWSHDYQFEETSSLVENLHELLVSLNYHKDFLAELRRTGGSVECLIGWFSGSNSGETFDYELLKGFGELEIDLALDVYGQSDQTVAIISEQ